jgi:hypothetical protein
MSQDTSTTEPLPDYPEEHDQFGPIPGRKDRDICKMRCRKCGHKDQLAAQVKFPNLTFRPCSRCHTWNWEFLGPDFHGSLGNQPQVVDNLVKRADPTTLMKSELWSAFCAVLDTLRVKVADGTFSDAWCVACVNEPHPDGRCRCDCHDAWELKRAMEASAE